MSLHCGNQPKKCRGILQNDRSAKQWALAAVQLVSKFIPLQSLRRLSFIEGKSTNAKVLSIVWILMMSNSISCHHILLARQNFGQLSSSRSSLDLYRRTLLIFKTRSPTLSHHMLSLRLPILILFQSYSSHHRKQQWVTSVPVQRRYSKATKRTCTEPQETRHAMVVLKKDFFPVRCVSSRRSFYLWFTILWPH